MKKITFLALFAVIFTAGAFAENILHRRDWKLINQLSVIAHSSSLRSAIRPSGMPTLEADSIITFNKSGEIVFKDHYQFDKDGNVICQIEESFSNSKWILASKEELEYDSNGNRTKLQRYRSLTYGEWLPEYTETYQYEDGKLISCTTVSSNGIPYIENISTNYDLKGRITSLIYPGSIRYDYAYDNANHITECIISRWNTDKSEWIPNEKEVFIYDEDGIPAEFNGFSYRNSDGKWMREIKNNIIFDQQGRISSIDMYEADDNDNWEQERSGYLILYYPVTTGIHPETVDSGVKIYAAGSTIRVESKTGLASVGIYNLAGNVIYLQAAKGNNITLTDLPDYKVYLVKVKEIDGKLKTQKIIIH